MTLIDLAISRTRTVIMTLVLVLISGMIAFIEIPKESMPDVNIPYIFVTMTYRGISPEDSERLLIRPMEQKLRQVEGIKEMTATAFEGGGNIVLEFNAGFNADLALADVREQVDLAKADLPSDADEPLVDELNTSQFPILVASLSGDVPERTLIRLAQRLQDEIEALPSVLEVDIGGDREEQVEIIIDPALVQSYGLTASEVAGFFSRSNTLIAAGALDTGKGRFSIKVPGLLEDIDDILNFPIKVNGDAVVRLGDIATGRRTFKDSDGYARIDGKSAVTLEIKKRAGENIINTVDAAMTVLTMAQQHELWPSGVQVSYSQDRSKQIKERLGDLQNSVITAIILVMVVVIGALGTRSGLLVGVSVPGSFLMAILALAAMGLTLNTVVLFALILAVGMLVDGAIVVTEYADRKMTEGLHRTKAYALAAQRMAWPVIASTATTLAAFLPLAFWPGIMGEFMKFLPITLILTLSASLLMALIFVPTLGALFGKPGAADPKAMKALAASEHGDVKSVGGLTGIYAHVLDVALRWPIMVIVLAVGMLIGSQVLYAKFGKGIEFFPESEPDQIALNVHARGNLSVEEKDVLIREVEELVVDLPGVKTVYARSGYTPQDGAEDIIGVVNLEYLDWDQRPKSLEIEQAVRDLTKDIAGLNIEIARQEHGPPSGKPIVVELSATNNDKLPAAVMHVYRAMEEIGGFVDTEDSLPLPGIEWEIKVNRAQAAKFGVDIGSVGDMVQLVTRGLRFSTYRPDDADDQLDIVARYPEEYRSLDQLQNLRVTTPAGQVPVASFVEITPNPMVSNINRVESKRVMTVKSEVAEGMLPDTKLKELASWFEENPFEKGVSHTFKGEDEDKREAASFLVKAFAVALFIMAIILVTQFNSFYSAFLILTAVIMSTIGVMLGLIVFQEPFGIVMGGIGVISLAGIVVNNNIVLIDTYDRLRHEFEDQHEAVLRTGVQRLRPVMLTTITTILGLLPMMYALNINFIARKVSVGAPSMQWWTQLSTSVVCGLTFATVLTLIVTPCALLLMANFTAFLKRMHKRFDRKTKTEEAEATPAE